MKNAPFSTYSESAAARALYMLGTSLFVLLSGRLLYVLTRSPVGSAGAIENLVKGYMEHALACLLIPLCAAAAVALIARD